MPRELQVTVRNARFQQWRALLDNRAKRQRAGEFLVQGVRPITMAVGHGWRVRTLIYHAGASLSRWAARTLDRVDAPVVAMSGELIGELGGKDEPPELVAVVATAPDDLGRIPVPPTGHVVVLDRPTSPGNIGTVLRSVDAFGAAGAIVTGHAADVYDPQAVRASTGSLFAVPAVRVPSHREVLGWADRVRGGGHEGDLGGVDLRIVGTDERGEIDVAGLDLTTPCLLVIGNETTGLSTAWQGACDRLVRIPIGGTASSLNAAVAASIMLYEAARQRGGVPQVRSGW